MSDPEGTPKKLPRLQTDDSEQNGSDRKSASSTLSGHTDNRSAPSTSFKDADNGNAPTSPFRLIDNQSASSVQFEHIFDRSAPPTPSRQAAGSSPSTPSRHRPEEDLSAVSFELKSGTASSGELAHLKGAGNEPFPALPIIVEDVDMEEVDKAGTSHPLDSFKSSFLSKTQPERPKSPITRWFQDLGAGLNSLSNVLLGCVKQPEVEKYKWICSFRYKPFGGDAKWLGQVYRNLPPHQTHLLGAAILDIHCFEVSTRKLQQVPADVIQTLGACVTFPTQLFSACKVDGCSRCSLYNCSACPHQYLCDCIAKEEYNGGEWCPHIHVAYAKNMDVYGAEACLFIQEDYTNLTEKRHIRAMIQGPTKMRRMEPNLYMEDFEYLVRSVRYHVKLNASEIPKSKCLCQEAKKCVHCGACWCRYSCTCEDYWYDRQVCEHIHNVVMQERKDEISLEEQFSFKHLKLSEIIFRDKPSIMHRIRESSMMAEHELSYHIPFKYVEEIEEGQTWRLASARDRRTATVSVNKQWQSSCICKLSTTTKAELCAVCNICAFHYRCDCIHAEEFPVCRHMHAMARYRQLELTNEDTYLAYKLEYYGKLMSEFEKKLRFTKNMPTRRPTGVRQSCSDTSTPTSSSSSSYTSAVDAEN